MLVHQGVQSGARGARGPWPHLQFPAHGPGDELVLGLLEDHGDAAQHVAARPLVRVVALAVRRSVGRGDADGPAQGGQQPRQGEGEGRLADAVGADDARGGAARDVQVDALADRRPRLVADGEAARAEDGGGGPAVRGGKDGRGGSAVRGGQRGQRARLGGHVVAGQPDPPFPQSTGLGGQHLVDGAVGGDRAVQDHHDAVDQVRPDVDAVLDDHQGGPRLVEDPLDRAAHSGDAHRVQVGGGLVEQQEAGSHGEDRGEGEPLLLAARQGGGGVVGGGVEADRAGGGADARPYLLAGDAQVLHAEGHVVADAGQDHLGLGVLHHEPDAAPQVRGGGPVDGEAPLRLALVLAAQEPGQPGHEGGLAGPGRPEDEDALAGLDPQVDAVEGPGEAAGVAPAPAARLHGGPAPGSGGAGGRGAVRAGVRHAGGPACRRRSGRGRRWRPVPG